MDRGSIGFNAELAGTNDKNISELLKDALPQDFVKIGMIPEFMGRVPITVSLEALADLTINRKTGARGLRAIMENVMMDLMYRIPSDKNIKKCTITKAMVEGTDEAVLEYRNGAIETEN